MGSGRPSNQSPGRPEFRRCPPRPSPRPGSRATSRRPSATRACRPSAVRAPATPPTRVLTPVPIATESETVLELSVADQPWWGDHAFYPQPEGWDCLEDRFPLVPLTALIEMLSDEAQKLVPGSVVV